LENTDLLQLIEKYRDNRCSPAEVKLLLRYFSKNSTDHDLLMNIMLESFQEQPSAEQLADANIQRSVDQAYLNIQSEITHSTKSKYTWKLWSKVLAAAAISLLVGFCYFYIFNNKNVNKHTTPINAQSVLPGGNRATLKLPDGKTINLSSAQSGIIIKDHTVTYKDGTSIPENIKEGLVTISTPKGGEYQIVLSDGTKVWLNASTTLQYSTLRERGQRKVKLLSGEAYFQVTKDKSHPFIVETATQQVEVLGTHFNVSNYADEGKIVTTLEEGLVKILSTEGTTSERNNILLRPGEQSINKNGHLSVAKADLQTALAWRNGLIKFKDAPLKSILLQASRWYNIEVEYEGIPDTELFTGGISRNANLEVLLRVLRLSGIKFKVVEQNNHKKLIVTH